VYRAEQGRRLFGVLGIGSSVGAVAGSRIARSLIVLGPEVLMALAAGILVVCVALYAWIDRHFRTALRSSVALIPEEPVSHEDPFRLLLRDRYLLLIAALTLLLNWCSANGEYILDRALLASVGEAHARGMSASAFVGAFKADYFAWVNIAGVTIQLFAVSRVLGRYGVRGALAVLPIVAFAKLVRVPSWTEGRERSAKLVRVPSWTEGRERSAGKTRSVAW
jgi:AAA family ATP:ADP antiporter